MTDAEKARAICPRHGRGHEVACICIAILQALREARAETWAEADGLVRDILNIGALDEHQDEWPIKKWHERIKAARGGK